MAYKTAKTTNKEKKQNNQAPDNNQVQPDASGADEQSSSQQVQQPGDTGNDQQSAQDKKTVMIVEDDPILLRMYTEKLTFEGYNVVTAKNGEDALKTASSENPDLIILDIMLPRMSGTDFLERFRTTKTGKNTPVVALTNLAEDEERQKAIKLGVKEYLVKAMQTPEQVLEKIKKYL